MAPVEIFNHGWIGYSRKSRRMKQAGVLVALSSVGAEFGSCKAFQRMGGCSNVV